MTGDFSSCRPRSRRRARWSSNVTEALARSLSMIQLPARKRKAFLSASSSVPRLRLLESVQTYSCANATFWRAEIGAGCHDDPAGGFTRRRSAARRGAELTRARCRSRATLEGTGYPLCGTSTARNPRTRIDWVGRDTAWGARESSTASHLARAFPSVWGQKIQHLLPEAPQEIARRQATVLFNLVPSTWDVFNFTAVEAMASGRPTIVSTGAGASELIEDQANGYLFASGDADALAGALDRLLGESPARLAAIGQAAQETVRTLLDPKAIAMPARRRLSLDHRRLPFAPAITGNGMGWRHLPAHGAAARQTRWPFWIIFRLRAIAAHVLARGRDKVVARMTPQMF